MEPSVARSEVPRNHMPDAETILQDTQRVKSPASSKPPSPEPACSPGPTGASAGGEDGVGRTSDKLPVSVSPTATQLPRS